MVDLSLQVKCECGIQKEISLSQIHKSKGADIDFTESIERNSDGLFYCLQNTPYAFQLVCISCGKETRVSY